MNAKSKNFPAYAANVSNKTAAVEAKLEHSILWSFFTNEAAHYVSKMSVVVALLSRTVAAMTSTMRNHNGSILSKRNGGAKSTTESATAKSIVDFFGSNLDLYFVEVCKECQSILGALEGMAEKGAAMLGAVNVKDTGNGTYAITSGSLLIRFRAALMTLSGDWSYLHSHKSHEAVIEFIEKWQEYGDTGGAMGFSPRYAFSFLAKQNCSELLEQIACHKDEVSRAVKSPDGDSGNKAGGEDTGGTVSYTPQVTELLKTVDLLKKAIVAVSDNASVKECEDWQAAISDLIGFINPQVAGDSEGAAKNIAPIIVDSNVPVNSGKVAAN